MRILIAPDSFKESLTATEAAEAMARGVKAAAGVGGVEVDLCPMADGGEGTVHALVEATGGEYRTAHVTGPIGEKIEARWGLLGDRGRGGDRTVDVAPDRHRGGVSGASGVVEMASAAGLMLVAPDRRDPRRTTTYGVGQLIRAALDVGCRRLIVGIGGSATNDGGAGMAQHLGVRFFNERGEITRPLTGADLITLTAIDHTAIDHRLAGTRIDVACDVTNPLTGERGAAATYGPQKGATPAIVRELDAGLRHLASLLPDIDPDQPGMGAAGGLGFGLTAFCGAKLRRGIEIVLDAVGFDDRVQRADLVLTGEGRLDGQSVQGKTCMGVVEAAAKREVPTVALVGSTGEGADLALRRGLSAYHTLVELAGSKHLAMRDAARLLEQLTAQIIPRYL